jgi:hypothetical protein
MSLKIKILNPKNREKIMFKTSSIYVTGEDGETEAEKTF